MCLLVGSVWGAAELLEKLPRLTVSLASVALVGCIAVTGHQLRYWQNSETVWRHTLAVTRNNFVAHHNLGYVLLLQQHYDEAASQTEEALRLHPDLIEAEYQLGFIKDQQHKFAEAIPYYQKAL